MRLTKEQISEIKKLKKAGEKIVDIARRLKVPTSTVQYHCNNKYKEQQKERAKKNQKEKKYNRDLDNYREYQRKYHKERYWRLKNKNE